MPQTRSYSKNITGESSGLLQGHYEPDFGLLSGQLITLFSLYCAVNSEKAAGIYIVM